MTDKEIGKTVREIAERGNTAEVKFQLYVGSSKTSFSGCPAEMNHDICLMDSSIGKTFKSTKKSFLQKTRIL